MKSEKIKSLVFISNYFNHHQRPLSNELYNLLGDGYLFIETATMSKERKNLGWGETDIPDYVVLREELLQNINFYLHLIDNADVVIFGSAPFELIQNRMKSKKLIYIYSERPFKKKQPLWRQLARMYTWRKIYPPKANIKLLCASAYTARDFAGLGLFKNKSYKWGYFPEVKLYEDIKGVIRNKKENSILWCARFIDWKHPEVPVEIAKRLKRDGYHFELNMIGNGVLIDSIRERVVAEKVDDCVCVLGSMTPAAVREHMEQSEIFMFTSDRGEGWGAVLNESMNSACAVVANRDIGSVPFLIRDRENGLIYEDGNMDDLYLKIKWLLDNGEQRKELSEKAYQTMIEEWNASNAAKKLLLLSEETIEPSNAPDLFEEGVCSKAKIVKDRWYKA